MKHCNSCDTDKPKSEFHIRRASKDGLSAKCLTCARAYDKARANQPQRVAARLSYAKSEAGLIAGARAKKAWQESNPKKRAAHVSIGNAIRDGKLTKKPCEICGTIDNIHAHHDDYNRVYDVRWLCSEHHAEWHKIHGEAANPF